MLKVMKHKNAVFGNPILRPELRLEARKLIGDTGLLDHLLKHMAGKVAPGGQDRFMRKHNADGAMEYWLESSDLVHIRKEAGVNDPFWTPPPGWKLGDSPTQDPICAGEIRDIRAELDILKRLNDGKLLLISSVFVLRRELEKLASKKDEELAMMMNTPISCVTSQNVDHDNMMPLAKEIYTDLLKKKDKIEDQLVTIAEALHKMESKEMRTPLYVADARKLIRMRRDVHLSSSNTKGETKRLYNERATDVSFRLENEDKKNKE
ncbi:hypothetical protein DY000_02038623 [Brassica cretica]|uniref:PTC1-like winged helix-turn-helix domain-containing protein n=1 Tax=Brassica cretica TaxID=69181 RepID=A0ABQ7BCT3_BRACR|nr:hypothetical protein DY000_02038623 [Brassica cretica]